MLPSCSQVDISDVALEIFKPEPASERVKTKMQASERAVKPKKFYLLSFNTKSYLQISWFSYKNIRGIASFAEILFLFLVIISLPLEKRHSDGTEVAGIAKNFRAKRERVGYVS